MRRAARWTRSYFASLHTVHPLAHASLLSRLSLSLLMARTLALNQILAQVFLLQ